MGVKAHMYPCFTFILGCVIDGGEWLQYSLPLCSCRKNPMDGMLGGAESRSRRQGEDGNGACLQGFGPRSSST
jgi:hypothetical protein